MKKLLLILPFVFILTTVFAQSLLWKVTGKGLKNPSYLYGTIHIQDKRVFQYGDVVTKAFDECEAFAMEILMDELNKEIVESNLLMKDKTLKEIMTPEDYELLDKVFKEKTGQGIFLFNKMKPFFVASQLMQADMSADMPEALDMYFLNMARKAGKIALGVEKFEDQIAAIDQISLEEQVKMMMDAVKDTTAEKDQFTDLLGTYLRGEIDKMPELSADTTLPEKFNEAFLINRNVNMAKSAIKFFKKQPTFVAIGAAHLGGPKGVIALIRKKGYTVEPVMFDFKTD